MNPLGRFFVCKLSATATVFSISPLWANEESGNDKQMNNNNVPINNVSMSHFLIFYIDTLSHYSDSLHSPIFSFFHWHIGILAHWQIINANVAFPLRLC